MDRGATAGGGNGLGKENQAMEGRESANERGVCRSVERIAHWIKPQYSTSVPDRFVSIDIYGESKNVQNRPGSSLERWSRAAAVCWRKKRHGYNPDPPVLCGMPNELWSYLSSLCRCKKVLWIVGCNLPRVLALMDTWERLESGYLTLHGQSRSAPAGEGSKKVRPWRGYVIVGQNVTVLYCRLAEGKGTLQFVGLENYYQHGLRELAESFGIKLEREDKEWPINSAGEQELPKRATVVGLSFRSLCHTVSERRLGQLCVTSASQGYASWLQSVKPKQVLVHANSAALKLERLAFMSGINQCRKLGRIEGPVYHLDFTWHYPSIMGSELMPAELIGHGAECSPGELLVAMDHLGAIAKVRLKDCPHPMPYRSANKQMFCTGNFVTTLCGPELELCLAEGLVAKVYEHATYKMKPIFAEWFKKLWSLRQEASRRGDKPMERVIKMLGNRTFGKFAQKRHRWIAATEYDYLRPYGEANLSRADGLGLNHIRWIGWRAEKYQPTIERRVEHDPATGERKEYTVEISEEHRESCPAIAAYVTAFGRNRLYSAQQICGRFDWFYCDTDSLWVSRIGFDRLQSAGKIDAVNSGALRVVGIHSQVEFRGLKDYTADNRRVVAGLPDQAQPDGEGGFVWEQSRGINYMLSSGLSNVVPTETVRWKRESAYGHGDVDADGWVTPFHLEE